MDRRMDGLDTLRGLTLLSMAAYHTCWDLVWMFGFDWSWYSSYGAYLWQQSICWTFILLSGFCAQFGRHTLRRGLLIFLCGAVISLFTFFFMPSNLVFFGVLSFMGTAMLCVAGLRPFLSRVPAVPGLALSFILFLLFRNVASRTLGFFGVTLCRLPATLYRNALTACLGFPPPRFYSTDYFPLLPWLFLFLCGYFLHTFADRVPRPLMGTRLPVVTALGRHSLWAYMLHQPLIYACLSLLFRR